MSFLFRNKSRIALFLLGVLGAIFAPSWVPLLAMGLLAFRYRATEVFAIGIFMDFLWLPVGGFFGPLPLFTIAALVLVWGLEPLRREFLISGHTFS